MKKTGVIMWAGIISSLICVFSLCLLAGDGRSYSNAENTVGAVAVSAIAENPQDAEIKEGTRFDDSVWGDLARALEKAVSRFLE